VYGAGFGDGCLVALVAAGYTQVLVLVVEVTESVGRCAFEEGGVLILVLEGVVGYRSS